MLKSIGVYFGKLRFHKTKRCQAIIFLKNTTVEVFG